VIIPWVTRNMTNNTDKSASSPRAVRLPASTSVRECAALKEQLLLHVEFPDSVLIDLSDVELIDTAALQLLFAFSRERTAKGLSTIWQGHGPTFRNAATAVGLQLGHSAVSGTNGE
jgi:phospholipid transport system transporter-binding protein